MKDKSRCLDLFWLGKTHLIGELHKTDLVIWGFSQGWKTAFYS